MAKTGSSSVSVSASGPSRKLTWLSARIGAGPAALRFSRPSTSSRWKARKRMETKSRKALVGRYFSISQAATALKAASPNNTLAIETPAAWTAATRMPPSVMRPALTMLTAATTRARRASGDQACTAAKVGTTRKALEMAMPARSMATRMVFGPAKKRPRVSALGEGCMLQIVQARCKPNSARSAVPTGAGSSTMRPCDIQAAIAEPMAMETANTAR